MKMLFLVCLFETIQAINASNTFSPSFHEVGFFICNMMAGNFLALGALQTPSASFLDGRPYRA
jgi:hypothetical protein